MTTYQYTATNLITQKFDEEAITYHVMTSPEHEELLVGIPVNNGPTVYVNYMSQDDDLDVSIRVLGLLTKVNPTKEDRVLKACNLINGEVRFLKFHLDANNNVNALYDFPVATGEKSIGDCAVELLVRIVRILDAEFPLLAKAVYTDDPLDPEPNSFARSQLLARLCQQIELTSKNQDTESTDNSYTEDAQYMSIPDSCENNGDE